MSKKRIKAKRAKASKWYGDFDDGPECPDSDIRCYGDNGKDFAKMIVDAGPESSRSTSLVSTWQRMTGVEMCVALSTMQLPRHAFYKSQHTRKTSIISPGSTEDVLATTRTILSSIVRGRTENPRKRRKRHVLLTEPTYVPEHTDSPDAAGQVAVRDVGAVLDRYGLLLKHADYRKVVTYSEPSNTKVRIGIDLSDMIATKNNFGSNEASAVGRELGVEITKSNKKYVATVLDHRVVIYPRGRIECARAATVLSARHVLAQTFSALQRCGIIRSGCSFTDTNPTLVRASFAASFGFPVVLNVLCTLLISQYGETQHFAEARYSDIKKTEHIKWSPSFAQGTVVKIDAAGSVDYILCETAKYDENDSEGLRWRSVDGSQTVERTDSTSKELRDDVLRTRYISLHRNLTALALATVCDMWSSATLGHDF